MNMNMNINTESQRLKHRAPLTNLPTHERRIHWLSATMSSFNRTLLWRAFRDRQWLVREQLRTLDIETTKLTRIAGGDDDVWTFPRLAAWLRHFASLHTFVITQYQQLMDSLTRTKRGWCERSRRFREVTIKRAVVLHAYVTLLANVYLDVFVFRNSGDSEPWLRLWQESDAEGNWSVGPLRTRHVRCLRRRWSWAGRAAGAGDGDGDKDGDGRYHQDAQTLKNRWEAEKRLSWVVTYLEHRVAEDMLRVKALYDEGELFREFCVWLAWTNEEKKTLVEMWGGRYKYSRAMWKIKVSQAPEWQPVDGVVLSWEEDELLMKIFC